MIDVSVDVVGIKGDPYGCVNVRFSVEALRAFIGMLAQNKIRGPGGEMLTFRVYEHEPGEAVLEVIATLLTEEPRT